MKHDISNYFRLLGSISVYNKIINNIYVEVIFLSQVIFVFRFVFGYGDLYASKVETKEKYKLTTDKKLTTTFTAFYSYS